MYNMKYETNERNKKIKINRPITSINYINVYYNYCTVYYLIIFLKNVNI